MRDKLGDRGQARNAGQPDTRLTLRPRAASSGSIVLTSGTPVVWAVADDYDMTTPGAMGSFTDRMGVAWSVTSSATGLIKCANAFNGRNCWMSAPAGNVAATCMQTAAVTTGDVSVFLATKECVYQGGFPAAEPILCHKGTLGAEWYFKLSSTQNCDFGYKDSNNALYTFPTMSTNGGYSDRIVAGRGSAAQGDLYVNGAIGGSSSVPTAGLSNTSSAIFLGANSALTRPSFWMFAEIIVYGTYLSDAARAGVEDYLGRQYGVAIM